MRMRIHVTKMMRIRIHNTAFYYIVLCCVLLPVQYCAVLYCTAREKDWLAVTVISK